MCEMEKLALLPQARREDSVARAQCQTRGQPRMEAQAKDGGPVAVPLALSDPFR